MSFHSKAGGPRRGRLIGLLLAPLLVMAGAAISAAPALASTGDSAPQGGTPIAWGSNSYGQTAVPADAATGVTAIAAGNKHSLALKADGSVIAWGDGTDGQTTVPAAATTGVTAIAAGEWHSLALKADGSVIAWGKNSDGQTTVPAAATSGVTAIAAGAWHSLALKADGSVIDWGTNVNNPFPVPASASSGVTAISAGTWHSLALKNDGSVVAWGDNTYGQITVPAAANSGVTAVAAGNYFSLALKADGSVIAWGRNSDGQTTVPTAATSGVIAIAAGETQALALKADGSVIAWGGNANGEATVPTGAGHDITAVAAGSNFSIALQTRKAPAITAQPVSASVQAGSKGSFTASASGVPAPAVKWQQEAAGGSTFTDIPGATSGTFTTGPVSASDSGSQYRAVFTNTWGQVTSDPATLTVPASPPAITAQPVSASVQAGSKASFTASASGVPAPAVKWQQEAAGGSTFTDIPGATSGTFTTGPVSASDSGSQYRAVFTNPSGQVTSNPGTLTVPASTPTIIAPNAALGVAYSYTLPVAGASVTVTQSAGTIPAGLTLGADGTLTGTPTVIGYTQFWISTTGNPSAAVVTISVQKGPTISGTAPDGQTSQQYSWYPTVTGGGSIALTAGSLPSGVRIVNGGLTGVPTVPGSYTFTLTVSNGYGAPQSLTSTVTIRQAPTITGDVPPAGNVGLSYSYAFTLSGTPAPAATITAGTLPDGLTLNPNGTISGTPTKSGGFSFTITAANGAATTATKQSSIFISPNAAITGTPPVATTGVPYSFGFTVGGSPSPVVSKVSGTLPPGLTLNANGAVTGTPTTAGTYAFTVGATNQYFSAQVQATITVGDAPVFSADAPKGTLGVGYSHAFTPTGTGTVTMTATGLPDGLSLSPAGTLSGTPTSTGSWTVSFVATNSFGTTTKTQTVTIDPSAAGQVSVVTPPASIQPGASESPNLQVFGEKMNQTLTSPLVIGGTTIPAGTKINSYLIHGDVAGYDNTAHLVAGSVSFGSKILAVATTTTDLQGSAGLLGNPSVVYATNTDEGLEYNDSATTGTTVGKVDLSFNIYGSTDDVRVITLAQ
jgi:hypothetical protein